MTTFDTVLKEINDFGRYQKSRYALICIAGLLPAIVTYIHSFAAPNPSHRCKNPYDSNDNFGVNLNNSLLNYENITKIEQCQITYVKEDNSTYEAKCDEWVFDKEYYHTTLTEDWGMVCDRKFFRGTTQTVYFLGYLIGSIVMGILSDRFGRKPLMLSAFVLIIGGSIGTAFGPRLGLGVMGSYVIYTISRFFIACGTRGINVTGFVLGMEMMGDEKRTFSGLVFEYFFGLGQIVLVFIAYFARDWETLSIIVIFVSLPFIGYFFILPESPRWLLSKKRDEDALKIIEHVAKVNKTKVNMDTWNSMLESTTDNGQNRKLETVFDGMKSRKLVIISCVLYLNWIVNNFVFYGVGLKSNDLGVSPYLSFCISASMEILSIMFSHAILDKLGRKGPYCALLFLSGVCCLSIIFIDSVVWSLVMAMAGKFCIAGAYAIIYLYSSELFPTSIRNSCMGACSMMARVGSMLAPLSLSVSSDPHFPFIVFGISAVISSVTAIILPETLHRPLPESIKDCDRTSKIGFSFKYTSDYAEGADEKEKIELTDK